MRPLLATSHARSPIRVFAETLLGGISTAHRCVTILTRLAAIRLHPVCHIFAEGFHTRHARSATSQGRAVPNVCVCITQEGTVGAIWHAHCPTSCFQKTLVPGIFATSCMEAVCVFSRTPFCHPWSLPASLIGTRCAHPNRRAIPSVVVRVKRIRPTRHAGLFASIPTIVFLETLLSSIFATPLLSAVFACGCTPVLDPWCGLCTIVWSWCHSWGFWAQRSAVPWPKVRVSRVRPFGAPRSAPCPLIILLEAPEAFGLATHSF
mmetsp:Transcript_117825/g.234735  ORF Transcript_117825/g.234735 Transcript_117825/m.234735 type:complete len:263 (-) Transcript_117825:317-1105(-)